MTDKIITILEEAKNLIQSNLSSKEISASGRTASGFKVEEYDGGIRLVYDLSKGGAPLRTTEAGRKSGKIPDGFIDVIEQWAIDKPSISFESESELTKFAGAVAFGKIKNRGFGRPSPSDYGSIDATVYSQVVLDTATRLYNEIPGIFASYIRLNLKNG